MDFDIYLIGDRNFFKSESLYIDALEKCFDCGIKAFQLRQKDVSLSEFIELGFKIKKLLDRYPDVKLFVNERVDVALALEAYGVHLNRSSLPVEPVKSRVKALKVFYSAHSREESMEAASGGADYIVFSPIFKTEKTLPVHGTLILRNVIESVRVPVFALGGINYSNAGEIRKAGGNYIAVQSGILGSDDVGTAAKKLIKAFKF